MEYAEGYAYVRIDLRTGLDNVPDAGKAVQQIFLYRKFVVGMSVVVPTTDIDCTHGKTVVLQGQNIRHQTGSLFVSEFVRMNVGEEFLAAHRRP